MHRATPPMLAGARRAAVHEQIQALLHRATRRPEVIVQAPQGCPACCTVQRLTGRLAKGLLPLKTCPSGCGMTGRWGIVAPCNSIQGCFRVWPREARRPSRPATQGEALHRATPRSSSEGRTREGPPLHGATVAVPGQGRTSVGFCQHRTAQGVAPCNGASPAGARDGISHPGTVPRCPALHGATAPEDSDSPGVLHRATPRMPPGAGFNPAGRSAGWPPPAGRAAACSAHRLRTSG